jgi:hypothetical protein
MAAITVALAVALAVHAVARSWHGTAPTRLTEALEVAFVLSIGVTSAGGLGVLAGGGHPRDPLHLFYAVAALSAIPIAATISRHATSRRRAVASALATLVILIVAARLYQTG